MKDLNQIIWCRNKECIHNGNWAGKDKDGYFARCDVEEVIISRDGKCQDFQAYEEDIDINDVDDEDGGDILRDMDYDTSVMCHENQVKS